MEWIDSVHAAKFGPAEKSPSIAKICKAMGLSTKTYYKWKANPDEEDKRKTCERPPNKLAMSQEEEDKLLNRIAAADVRDKSLNQAFFYLLDRGEYYGSRSSFYRKFKKRVDIEAVPPRDGTERHPPAAKPPEGEAKGPNEIWSWDATPLGRYHLYVAIDIYSRMVVGWEVYEADNAANALDFWRKTFKANFIAPSSNIGLRIHADNGAAMRAASTEALFKEYNVFSTHSRPYVSDDNAFSEALFATLNIRMGLDRRYMSLEECRATCKQVIYEYNWERYHSGINHVIPAIRHKGPVVETLYLERRQQVLEAARAKHPERWIQGKVMNCKPAGPQYLNRSDAPRPERSGKKSGT